MHLGVGAFHRAHQADYTDDVLRKGDRRWGIIGASLRSPRHARCAGPAGLSLHDRRKRRGGRALPRHRRAARGARGAGRSRSAASRPWPSRRSRSSRSPSPKRAIATIPATGELNEHHPDIVHDLANPLRAALGSRLPRRGAAGTQRRAAFRPSPCCAATIFRPMAAPCQGGQRALPPCATRRFGSFVAENVAFPSTMVDRIVPATTDADRARIAAATGLHDAWPVVTEVYQQLGGRGSFPARPARMGGNLRHRYRALRADEAAAAQWGAFLHGLSGLSRRP